MSRNNVAQAQQAPASPMRLVMRSGGARMLVVPVTAILGIVNTRLIIDHFGSEAYAQFGLLVGIVSLLPFADLGVSAAVMNAIAASDDPSRDAQARKVLATAIRVLVCSMAVLVTAGILLLVTGSWRPLLGDGLLPGSGPVVATLCLGFIAVGMPIGFGERILSGIGRNHVNVVVTGLRSPLVLLALLLLVTSGLHVGAYIPLVSYATTFALTAVVCWLAARRVAPLVGHAVRDAFHVMTVPGGGVFAVAWPTLVQMTALPIAMQTDRIVLSHVSSVGELARYNLASQMFTPVWGVVNAAGVALWPVFAKSRAKRELPTTSPQRAAVLFGLASAVLCLAIAGVAPWLAARASGGAVRLPVLLLGSFVVLMTFQAVKYPLGMYMTDPRGLRYQAFWIVLLLPVNLGLSWILALHLGAAGPVIGSAVGVFLCQVAANWHFVRADLRRRRASP